ncbi:NAD(P)/FAD-dependent oxidoreductase [Lacibacterium aquatile]|uniref:NAD(P)/FAD-dependent oxidoreductase n=1 Tax=Lacibacterium aquatile TaxID=1168082 RepID=A0ABW5DKH9_9PROT
MSDPATVDVVILGAGMAGASLAYHLAGRRSVVILEQELAPGFHSTGRSAAIFTETYGPAVIRALTRGSRAFLTTPPTGFADHALIGPRGALAIALPEKRATLDAFFEMGKAHGAVERFGVAETLSMVPVIKPEYADGAVYEPGALDMDVNGLHQGYLKGAKAGGVELRCEAAPRAIRKVGDLWELELASGILRTRVLVNAAGAWGDKVAELAGIATVGLIPKRRTALLFDPPDDVKSANWPLVDEIDQEFYFKPDAGRIFGSPADETPVEPCDVQPDEYDLAVAAYRIEEATTMPIRRLLHKWAGLRSFVADGLPVVGFEAAAPGFFWLVGQGGYGIQTADGMARLSAALILGEAVPGDLIVEGVDPAELTPARFRG